MYITGSKDGKSQPFIFKEEHFQRSNTVLYEQQKQFEILLGSSTPCTYLSAYKVVLVECELYCNDPILYKSNTGGFSNFIGKL